LEHPLSSPAKPTAIGCEWTSNLINSSIDVNEPAVAVAIDVVGLTNSARAVAKSDIAAAAYTTTDRGCEQHELCPKARRPQS